VIPAPKLPRISVIIPVYNRPRLAVEAVRSVLLQSYPQLECLLVDDGSTEPPEEAIRLFSVDPRFRYLRSTHSGMPGAVRNRGVAEACYDLLAFLDSDDIWLPQKLELQAAKLMERSERRERRWEGAALVHSKEIWLRGEKIVSQKRHRHKREGYVFADALKKCMIGPSTVLMRRDVFEQLGGFREDLEIAEDYELWLRLSALYPVEYVEEPLIVKRAGHGGQLSEKYGHIELFRLKGLEDLVTGSWFDCHEALGSEGEHCPEGLTAGHSQKKAAAELSKKCAIYAAGCRSRGRIEEAESYEAKAARYAEH